MKFLHEIWDFQYAFLKEMRKSNFWIEISVVFVFVLLFSCFSFSYGFVYNGTNHLLFPSMIFLYACLFMYIVFFFSCYFNPHCAFAKQKIILPT